MEKTRRWMHSLLRFPGRQFLPFALLFAFSYSGLLFYTRPEVSTPVAAEAGARPAPRSRDGASLRDSKEVRPQAYRPAAESGKGARDGSSASQSGAPMDGTDSPAGMAEMPELENSDAYAELTALSAQASGAGEPQERAKAIVRLRNVESSPQALATLSFTLTNDQVARNRMLAVAALRSLAARGDPDGVIRAALMQAATDVDPRVASLARDAVQSMVPADAAPQS